jgi:hypothetical protein
MDTFSFFAEARDMQMKLAVRLVGKNNSSCPWTLKARAAYLTSGSTRLCYTSASHIGDPGSVPGHPVVDKMALWQVSLPVDQTYPVSIIPPTIHTDPMRDFRFRRSLGEIHTLLCYHAALSGRSLPTFQDNLSVLIFKGQEIQVGLVQAARAWFWPLTVLWRRG